MYDCHRFAEGCPDQNYFSFESFKCKLLSISFVLRYASLRFDNVLPHQLSEFVKYVMHIFVRFVSIYNQMIILVYTCLCSTRFCHYV